MKSLKRVVLDTDTYNEVDDQFALAHLLMAPEAVSLEAAYAAPFFNHRSSSPADGMERSFQEIHRIIDLVAPERQPDIFRGSTRYLPTVNTPVESDAARDLVARAQATRDGEMLYVIAIAAATNVASALLLAPHIAEKITVVWLGGHGPDWPHTREFNLQQDPYAARVLLDSGVPLVLLPCHPVASHLITTVAELECHLAPFSPLGQYLTDIVREYEGNPPAWSKIIWDIIASAWIINPEWVTIERRPAPILKKNLTWENSPQRRLVRIAREVNRDAIFGDFFARARLQARHRDTLLV
ncbi:nucleoside hydrolase [Spartobacteria bacterium LR76]|nr:nucleoside hydrolase [Spartobacteria bacterium LR76]